ncbi:MAG: hypothetical protein KAT68_05500 [Bacteroidales bacterium]|nr:hypothetical protein [Bacteroidales bacterium]
MPKHLKIPILISVLSLIAVNFLLAQEKKQKNWTLDGYVSNMQSSIFTDIEEDWISNNLIHNRLNFNYYLSNTITINIEGRNRFMYGELIKNNPEYASFYENDPGFIDLTTNILEETSFILNSTIDRAKVDITINKLNIIVGRQRINWAHTFVWNPNDIFNSYSFFDFDYVEKSGSDALRLQYYTNLSSSAELSAKIDKDNRKTIAGLFRFNKWKYDIQILGGLLNDEDYVIGAGWSGNIVDAGFSGEFSYFSAKDKNSDPKNIFLSSISINYIFKNSLFLQFEVLYIDMQQKVNITSFTELFNSELTVKNLSFTKLSLFGQVSFPITPILNSTFSAMYYPEIDGYFIGPSLSYSFNDNTDFSIFFQSFSGELTTGTKEKFNMGFLRLKYCF